MTEAPGIGAASSQLAGGQQQADFTVREAGQGVQCAQLAVELFLAVGADLGQQVSAAV